MGVTRTMTVFVVSDDEHGTALREIFARWTVEEIVGPSLWVSPAAATVSSSGPPQVDAELIQKGGRTVGDLFHHIGRHRLDAVRVVVGQLYTLETEGVDTTLLEAASAIGQAIDDALPRSHREDGHTARLWRINIIAPVSGVTEIPTAALVPSWNVNAVVSAEDRPDADHANVFVRHPGNAVGHAAAALAAAGGVFAGIDEGAFDVLEPEQSTSNGSEITMLRVAVRAVVGDDAETRLAIRTLESVADEPQGAAAFVEWGRTAVNPDRVVADLDHYLRSREPWASGVPESAPRAQPTQSGFRSAIREAVAFDARMFMVVPKWQLLRSKARNEDAATNAIVGDGADTVVRFHPASPEAMRHSAEEYLKWVDANAERSEIERASEGVATPDARAWAHLRSVLFAAADGGDLPPEIETPRYAGVRELLPAGLVVPDPDDTFTARGRTVQPADPAGARALGAEIEDGFRARDADLQAAERRLRDAEEALTLAEAAVDEAQDECDRLDETIAALSDADDDTGEPAADADSADGAESTARPSSVEERRKAAAKRKVKARAALARAQKDVKKASAECERVEAEVTAARAAFTEINQERAAYRTWSSRVGGSVLYKLIDDVSQRSRSHREHYHRLRAALASVTPDDSLQRAQGRLIATWRVTLWLWVAMLVLTGGAWLLVALQQDGRDRAPDVANWLHDHWYVPVFVGTLLAFVVLALANHAYYRANRRFVGAVQQAATRRIQASEDVVFNGRESSRLAQLGPTLVDWAAIIGQVLHRPHGSVENITRTLDESVVDTLPASFAVARTADDDEIPRQTLAHAVRLLYPERWAANAFDHAYEMHQESALTPDPAGLIAADLDNSESVYGPRHALVRYWTSREASAVLTRSAVETLREAVLDEQLVLSTRRVLRLGPFGTGEVVSEPDFYRAAATATTAYVNDLFTEIARVDGSQNVHRSAVWLPAVAAANGAADVLVSAVGGESVALRVDVSRRLSPEDLVVFCAPSPDAPASAESTPAIRETAAATWAPVDGWA